MPDKPPDIAAAARSLQMMQGDMVQLYRPILDAAIGVRAQAMAAGFDDVHAQTMAVAFYTAQTSILAKVQCQSIPQAPT